MEAEEETVEAFAEGLREILTLRLAEVSLNHGFNVIPSSRVRGYNVRTSAQIGKDVGANLGLASTIEYAGGSLKVTLFLVPPDSDRRLRRGEVSGSLEQASDLAHEVTGQALDLLGIEAKPTEVSDLFGNGNDQPACALFLKGLGYYLKEDFQGAVENLQDALNLDANFALAKAYLGLTYLEQNRMEGDRASLDEAFAICQSARDIEEDLQVAHFCLGEALLRDDKLKEALKHYERANHLGPFSDNVLLRILSINLQLGRGEAIMPMVKEAADRQPQFWLPVSLYAYAYFVEDHLEEAISLQKRVVELAPEYLTGFTNLAASYDKLGCVENALRAYERALEIDKKAVLYTNLATTHFYMGQYREALKYARQGIVFLEDEPESAGTYIDRGNLADILYWSPGGDQQKAIQNYETARVEVEAYLQLNPGDLEALAWKAMYLAMLGERQAAEAVLTRVLEADDERVETLYKAAIIYQHFGHTEKAVDYLARSLEAGVSARRARNEPIFQESPELRELLSEYPDQVCPFPEGGDSPE
jgi:tetratricopeptide (TPR) repeat protein